MEVVLEEAQTMDSPNFVSIALKYGVSRKLASKSIKVFSSTN